MPYSRFVEIGRLVYINGGAFKGKVAVIVDVVDQNRALVSLPATGVTRHACNFKNMSLTGIVVDRVAPSCGDGPLTKAVEKSGALAAWAATAWAKKLGQRATRAGLNDFQRFQVKSHKQKRARIVRSEFRKLKKS